jgi:hypothetical protein
LGVGGVRGAREGGGGAGAVVVQEARPHSMVSLRPGGRARGVVSARGRGRGGGTHKWWRARGAERRGHARGKAARRSPETAAARVDSSIFSGYSRPV